VVKVHKREQEGVSVHRGKKVSFDVGDKVLAKNGKRRGTIIKLHLGANQIPDGTFFVSFDELQHQRFGSIDFGRTVYQMRPETGHLSDHTLREFPIFVRDTCNNANVESNTTTQGGRCQPHSVVKSKQSNLTAAYFRSIRSGV
jgi:hypothetical protein